MFLKILEIKPLLRHLFKGKVQEFNFFLRDSLDKTFVKREHSLYEIDPHKLPQVNDFLFSLRETFKKDLFSAPLPVSFYLFSEASPSEPKVPFRAGKIYFHKSLYKEILEVFSKLKLFFKIEAISNEVYELLLPSTVDPKLNFPYKDIFYIPLEERCFFCHSHWHATSDCPGLDIQESLDKFKEILKFSLEEVAEKLYAHYLQRETKENFLDYFFIRHFYLFPSFLKVPLYLVGEIENWSQLTGKLVLPIKGGEIFLALEDLLHKRWSQAELRLKNLEEDFRLELLFMMLSILKGDFKRALYHIERALTFVKTPFLLSYLYFYKGYIHHIQGDIYQAEDNYKTALKEDTSCVPAFYFLHLLNYEENHSEKIFSYFRHPFLIYLAFLEPKFIKHEEELERELENAISSLKEEALIRLKEAEDKFHNLKEVMPEETIREIEETLKEIRQGLYKGGIALIEEAGKRALELSLELSGYVFSRTKKIKGELQKLKNQYQILYNFWNEYPYKTEDAYFGQRLSTTYNLIEKMQKIYMRKDISKELKILHKELERLKKNIEELSTLKSELQKKWRFRKKLFSFIRRFSLAEGFLISIYLFPLLFPKVDFLGPLQNLTSFVLFSFLILVVVLITLQLEEK